MKISRKTKNKSKNNINILQFNYNVKNINKKNKKKLSNKKGYTDLHIKKTESIYNIKNDKMYYDLYKINNLNDEELNNLEYEIAIIIDKRTYFQYYCSLLKKKHLIFFAFYPSNDYNLMAVKISLLLLSFSLYFTINGFFFSDSTMNKINEDKGAYNILYQIPQILYSTIISAIINMILKRLSLSENQIIAIKSQKYFLMAKRKSISIKRCLNIKLSIFLF